MLNNWERRYHGHHSHSHYLPSVLNSHPWLVCILGSKGLVITSEVQWVVSDLKVKVSYNIHYLWPGFQASVCLHDWALLLSSDSGRWSLSKGSLLPEALARVWLFFLISHISLPSLAFWCSSSCVIPPRSWWCWSWGPSLGFWKPSRLNIGLFWSPPLRTGSLLGHKFHVDRKGLPVFIQTILLVPCQRSSIYG